MWSLLICVNSEIEADIINGLLEEAKIPTQKKDPGGLKASYGIINGIEIWVPSESLENAQELLKELPAHSESSHSLDDEDANELSSLDRNLNKLNYRLISKPIVVCFIIILLVLIYGVLKE